jgi:hypothetical protein
MSRYTMLSLATGRDYRLRLDINALADLEDVMGVGIGSLVVGGRMGLSTIRALLWAALKWEERSLTMAGAGDLISEHLHAGGELPPLVNKLTEALQLSGILGPAKPAAEETDGPEGNGEAGA